MAGLLRFLILLVCILRCFSFNRGHCKQGASKHGRFSEMEYGVSKSPDKCKPFSYSRLFKTARPLAYTYEYCNDSGSCAAGDYRITFCRSPHTREGHFMAWENNSNGKRFAVFFPKRQWLQARRILLQAPGTSNAIQNPSFRSLLQVSNKPMPARSSQTLRAYEVPRSPEPDQPIITP